MSFRSAWVDAGIRTVMIAGDHKATAIAIVRELCLLKDGLSKPKNLLRKRKARVSLF